MQKNASHVAKQSALVNHNCRETMHSPDFSRHFWSSETATDDKSILSSSDNIRQFSTRTAKFRRSPMTEDMCDSAQVDKKTYANSAQKL